MCKLLGKKKKKKIPKDFVTQWWENKLPCFYFNGEREERSYQRFPEVVPSHQLVLEVSLERGDNCILSLHFEWDFWWILHLHRNNCCMNVYFQICRKPFFAYEFSSHSSDHRILDHTRIKSLPEAGLGLPVAVCVSLWGLKLQLKKYWKRGHYLF